MSNGEMSSGIGALRKLIVVEFARTQGLKKSKRASSQASSASTLGSAILRREPIPLGLFDSSTVSEASLPGGKIGGFLRCICDRRRPGWPGRSYLCAEKGTAGHGRGRRHSAYR